MIQCSHESKSQLLINPRQSLHSLPTTQFYYTTKLRQGGSMIPTFKVATSPSKNQQNPLALFKIKYAKHKPWMAGSTQSTLCSWFSQGQPHIMVTKTFYHSAQCYCNIVSNQTRSCTLLSSSHFPIIFKRGYKQGKQMRFAMNTLARSKTSPKSCPRSERFKGIVGKLVLKQVYHMCHGYPSQCPEAI